MFRFKVFLPFFINSVILAIIVETTLSANQQYEVCEPKHCGNVLNISYPFWLQNKHESYCGHPSFGITCIQDKPMIRISNDDYIIRKIDYQNQTVMMVDTDIVNKTCPTPLHNISLYGSPFEFGSDTVNLYFFYNCSSVPKDYFTYPVSCVTRTDTSQHSFAAFLHEQGLQNLSASAQMCETMVSAPVDLEEGVNYDSLAKMDYADILKKGFPLEWPANNCSDCERTGGRCGLENLKFYIKFVCFCQDGPHSKSCKHGSRFIVGKKVAIVLGAGIAVAIVILVYLRRKAKHSMLPWKKKTETTKHIEEFLKNHDSLGPKRYNYKEVKVMTRSFKNKLGKGGYGEVFEGVLNDGSLVAVKVLSETKGNGEEFINEVASISRTSHVNIVSLLGYCFEGSKTALLYEFMPNGSLEKFIYDEKRSEVHSHLGWETLYQIAVGIARGLEYLHRGCHTRILHFDIKPHNILLDQDFIPKISDFGLAKLCPRKESIISMLGTRGTAGYIAPEVFSRNFGGVSHKSDVYSYGMMILEMTGGRKNIDVRVDPSTDIYFPDWIYKCIELDEDLEIHGVVSEEERDVTKKMVLVGLWCIQTRPSDRPSMSRVLEMLEGSLEVLPIPPKPCFSSSVRVSASISVTEDHYLATSYDVDSLTT